MGNTPVLFIPGIGISYLEAVRLLGDHPLFQERCTYAEIDQIGRLDMGSWNRDHNSFEVDTLFNQKLSYVANCTMCDLYARGGVIPEFVVGYSMGLYAALYCAGHYDFQTGLVILEKAYNLIRACCSSDSQQYGMGLLLGLTEQEVRDLLFQGVEGKINIAVCNGKRSFVIAGYKEILTDCITKALKIGALGARTIETSHPYHTVFLKKTSLEFIPFLKTLYYSSPVCRAISLIDGKIISRNDAVEVIAASLYKPLRFDLAVQALSSGDNSLVCFETGPPNAMGKLVRYIEKRLRVRSFVEKWAP